jgi:D-alanyl-D-alanine carboxypeptidase
MMKKTRKGGYIMKTKKIVLILLLMIVIFFIAGEFSDRPREATLRNGWNLICVNENHIIPEDYEVNLITLSNGQRVDERIYPDLQKMFDDMRQLGHRPFVRSGYRSSEEQENILLKKAQEYVNEGYSEKTAEKLALQWVAEPGTSEHQLGIAVDINPDYRVSKGLGFYDWLRDNAHKYGFVKRYPDDKVGITGISNEPWHYRYVGEEVAEIMYEENLCLEEYVENCFMQE